MLRYKGVLHMKGTDRKVIFQGVHQLMGSDLGPEWAPGEKKQQQDGLHRHRPAEGHPPAGPGAVPGLTARLPASRAGHGLHRMFTPPSVATIRGAQIAARKPL